MKHRKITSLKGFRCKRKMKYLENCVIKFYYNKVKNPAKS